MASTLSTPNSRATSAKSPGKEPRIPSLRHHRASGQDFVILNGKTTYLGRHGLEETTQNYHRTIAEWLANDRQLRIDPEQITVKELLARFWLHAQQYYRRSNGRPSGELAHYGTVMKFVKKLYADTPAAEFGPMALRVVREQMVAQGWCRKSVNRMVGRIKSIFRWATEHELIPGNVYHSIMALAGLRMGYSQAPDGRPVHPVPMELIEAVKPFLGRQVRAMIELQLLTAARPGELCIMRRGDIDRSGTIWLYRPLEHKTAHREKERVIYLGPNAQRILMPFLLRPDEAYCFSPMEAWTEHYRARQEKRTTPPNQGNRPGHNCAEDPQRRPGDRYDVNTYRRAIARACDLAFPLPEHLRPQLVQGPKGRKRHETGKEWRERLTATGLQEVRDWHKAHRWHPHQLRHNAATELRKEFGLETARIILGHHSPAVTLIYAEADHAKAIAAMEKVG